MDPRLIEERSDEVSIGDMRRRDELRSTSSVSEDESRNETQLSEHEAKPHVAQLAEP